MPKKTINERHYDLYSFFYDLLVYPLRYIRRKGFMQCEIKVCDKVAILGCGSGNDFPFLPSKTEVYAIDLSQNMLIKAQRKAQSLQLNVSLIKGDAATMPYPDASMHWALLHLILAVTDKPDATLNEAIRLVGVGGYISIFDKFAPDDVPLSFLRRMLRPFLRFLGTDIGIKLQELTKDKSLKKISEKHFLLGQFKWCVYQVIE